MYIKFSAQCQAHSSQQMLTMSFKCFTLFLKDFIYLFLDREKGREKERERNITVWLPLECPPWGSGPPGMCP